LSLVEVLQIPNGAFQENCYLVAEPDSGIAVLIDPGDEADRILSIVRERGVTLQAVWLTHAHIDHVSGVARVAEATGIPIFLHPDDRQLYDGAAAQGAWFGLSVDPPPPPDRELVHGDALELGSLRFGVRHVPGHSPGSVAFVGHGVAIVGDALFAGSVGRVDLPGGDGPTLLHSIREQLLTLPDDTVVYAGHGPETTIGRERTSNPFLTGAFPLA
jgi:glyoxylase-like metal-dependent hydrolase (beta-lactamase superfamily II)